MGDAAAGLANPMLGSQLVNKSILTQHKQHQKANTKNSNEKEKKQANVNHNNSSSRRQEQQQQKATSKNLSQNEQQATNKTTSTKSIDNNNSSSSSSSSQQQQKIVTNKDNQIDGQKEKRLEKVESETGQAETASISKLSKQDNIQLAKGQFVEHNAQETSPCKPSPEIIHMTTKQQQQQQQHLDHHNLSTNTLFDIEQCKKSTNNNNKKPINERDFELLVKETQDLLSKIRKLQLEIDEKNEIINVLKDELETTKEQQDKYERENIQLLKDSKRVKFLQDENDFLQDKVGNVDKLELEIKKLKEKLAETEFLKLRIQELDEDKTKAQEESNQFEEKWKKAEANLHKIAELEKELIKWKSFSQELELEKNSIQTKLMDSIEQEAKLNQINKQVEDEMKRLRLLNKSLEEQRDEEQASNSLIFSAADLKQLNLQISSDNEQDSKQQVKTLADESNKEIENVLNEENRNLKQQLSEQEKKLTNLLDTNKIICDELDSNKKLISDLRQDLACEKNLATKLTKQLTTFTKQIRNLDKNYFPMHETKSLNHPGNVQNGCDSSIVTKELEKESSLLKSVTPIDHNLGLSEENTSLNKNSDERKKKTNETNKLQGNNSDSKNNDNETKQQVNTKLSDLTTDKRTSLIEISTTNAEIVAEVGVEKNSCLSKHGLSSSKQSITEGKKKEILNEEAKMENILSNAIEQTEKRFAKLNVTNKSNASFGNDNAETSRKDRLLSTAAGNQATITDNNKKLADHYSNKNLQLSDYDRSMKTSEESSRQSKNGNNNNCVRGVNSDVGTPSVSPSSNACSSTSSPSKALNVGQDSGFHSINHGLANVASVGVANDMTCSSTVDNSKTPNTLESAANQQKPISGDDKNSTTATETYTYNANQNMERKKVEQNSVEFSKDNKVPTKLSSNKKEGEEVNVTPDMLACRSQTKSTNESKEINKSINNCPTTASITAASKFSHKEEKEEEEKLVGIRTSKKFENVCKSNGIGLKDPAVIGREKKNCDVSLDNNSDIDGEDEDEEEMERIINMKSPVLNRRTSTPVKSARVSSSKVTPTLQISNNNFVRNSMSSRSVNFGHSKQSAYLDRFRASVKATTTTNTSSSFEEQTRNLVLIHDGQQQQQNHNLQPIVDSSGNHCKNAILNCMLDHQHTARCFIVRANNSSLTHQQHQNHHHHHHQQQQQQHHHHHHLQPNINIVNGHHSIGLPMQSSQQINALIDPMPNEQVFLNVLQQQQQKCLPMGQQNAHQYPNSVEAAHHLNHVRPYLHLNGAELTEQQIAQLANLHHQHYYHHLQHMHKLHQLHHQHHLHQLHRMHHKYDHHQQQPLVNQPEQQAKNKDSPTVAPTVTPSKTSTAGQNHNQQTTTLNNQQQISMRSQKHESNPLYLSSSQFYAPAAQLVDQNYANMAANNQINEQKLKTNKLVNSNNNNNNNNNQTSPIKDNKSIQKSMPTTTTTRLSPQRTQIISHYTMPQIDEINGLPVVVDDFVSGDRPTIVPRTTTNTGHSPYKQKVNHLQQQQQQQQQVIMASTKDALSNANGHKNLCANNKNGSSNGSPTSSSPTSSTSSNLSASSASSSGTSLNSFTGMPLINRTPLRHTTTDLIRTRQFSVEKDLVGAMPMTATLSRVGSCRAAGPPAALGINRSLESETALLRNNNNQHFITTNKNPQISTSQTAPRATKTTNLQSQQPQQLHGSRTQQSSMMVSNQQTVMNSRLEAAGGGSGATSAGRAAMIASNLADIKFDDRLAFSSLRAPKNSTIMGGCSRDQMNNNNIANYATVIKQQQTSSSELVKLSSKSTTVGSPATNKQNTSITTTANSAKTNNNDNGSSSNNNSNKSSVWFEYGCV